MKITNLVEHVINDEFVEGFNVLDSILKERILNKIYEGANAGPGTTSSTKTIDNKTKVKTFNRAKVPVKLSTQPSND